jgi:hypothetical protein
MDNKHFSMAPLRQGRLRYLLLVLLPALLLQSLLSLLVDTGILPNDFLTALVVFLVAMAWIIIAGVRLIFRKNHNYVIADNTINVTEFTGKTRTVSIRDVASYKRNWLGELVLKDSEGKTLLTAEANMENFDLFKEYLALSGITEE